MEEGVFLGEVHGKLVFKHDSQALVGGFADRGVVDIGAGEEVAEFLADVRELKDDEEEAAGSLSLGFLCRLKERLNNRLDNRLCN